MSDKALLNLLRNWARAKQELFRFGAEEYSHGMSPLYEKEHGQKKALREYRRVTKRMTLLTGKEHDLKWKLYQAAKERL